MIEGVRRLHESLWRSKPTPFRIFTVVVAVIAALLVFYPLVRVFTEVVGPGADSGTLARTLALPGLGQTLLNTLIIVVVAGSLALFMGFVLAWLNERTDARIGWVTDILPVMPLLVPPIAAVVGWVFLLSEKTGIINVIIRNLFGLDAESGPFNIFSWPMIIALYTIEMVPIVYLVISGALRNLDPDLEQASRTSGAGVFRTLRLVTIPAMKPALAAAGWLSVTAAVVIFSVPAVIGTPAGVSVLSTQIVGLLYAVYPAETAMAAMLGLFLLAVIGIAGFVRWLILRGGHFAKVGGKGVRHTRVELGRWKWVARTGMLLFISVSTIIPAAGLAVISVQKFWSAKYSWDQLTLRAWESLFHDPYTQEAIWNSVQLASVGAIICLVIALFVTLLNTRMPGRLSSFFGMTLKVPAGFSNIIIALGVLLGFAGPPFSLSGTIAILLIAYVVIQLPQGSVMMESAVSQVDSQLIEASHISGAGETRTTRLITMPLVLPSIAAAWIMIFVYMAGDLTASVLLAGVKTPTAGYLMYVKFTNGTYPEIAAFGLLISSVFTVIVIATLALTRRRQRN